VIKSRFNRPDAQTDPEGAQVKVIAAAVDSRAHVCAADAERSKNYG